MKKFGDGEMTENKKAAVETAGKECERLDLDKVAEKAKALVKALQEVENPLGHIKITVTHNGFWFSSFSPIEEN